MRISRKTHYKKGGKTVPVSDRCGAVINTNCVDLPALLKHKEDTGSLKNPKGGDEMNAENLVMHKSDVLLPCALGCVFNKYLSLI